MVLIAASGIATGGRVVHHLKAFAPDALRQHIERELRWPVQIPEYRESIELK